MVTKLNLSCRFDFCGYNSEICLLQDHKSGWDEPDPVKMNAQMRVQTLIAAINLQRIGITPKRFIAQVITMPFGVLQAEFSYTELKKMYEDITATLAEIESPMALVNPSIEACDKCPAILVCNAVKSLSVKLNPINTNPDALSHNLDKIKILQKQYEEFEKFCERGLLGDPNADPPIPPTLTIRDYEIVPGVERRDWRDIELAQQRLINEGIPEHKFKTLKTHTPAAYEKIYAAHYGQKPDELRETFNTLFADCFEIKRNKGSLKRIKDVPKIKVLP